MTAEKDAEALEAAARAAYTRFIEGVEDLEPSWEEVPEDHRDRMRVSQEAAVTAYLAHRADAGWRMMPREPTPGMREAAGLCAQKINPAMKGDAWKAIALDSQSIYRAMFDAAGGGDA